MKILLLGASGLVGKNVLAQALTHPAIAGVVAPTRRPLAPHAKLINPVSDHLESLLSEDVAKGVEGVVCALGTTISKAGSKEAFREVDYVLPLAFARLAHKNGAENFVLVSASVASVNSSLSIRESKARSSGTSNSSDLDHLPLFGRASSVVNGTNRASGKASLLE